MLFPTLYVAGFACRIKNKKMPIRPTNIQFAFKHRSPKTTKPTVPASRYTILKNHLLAALPAPEFRRIEPLLEPVSFELGQVLYEPNKRADYAYFPTTAIVSLLYIMENGSTAAVSVTGNDGMVGIALFMGAETVPNEAIVQCAGEAFKIRYWDLQKEFGRGGVLQTLLLRFTMATLNQTSQTAACNRLHSVEQQLCRWLLLTCDRFESNKLEVTHDLISKIIGVSREGISLTVKKLKEKKLIDSARGTVTLIDRHGMEAAVCECYRRIAEESKRLFDKGFSNSF